MECGFLRVGDNEPCHLQPTKNSKYDFRLDVNGVCRFVERRRKKSVSSVSMQKVYKGFVLQRSLE